MMTGRTHTYLHADYLQPSDNQPEIDLKQSPLVLLAQTCSAIGKDCSTSKMQQRTKTASTPFNTSASASGGVGGLVNAVDVATKNLSDPQSRKESNNGGGMTSKSYSNNAPSVSESPSCKMSPRSDLPLDLKATNNVQKRSKSPLGGTSPPVKKLRTSLPQHEEGKQQQHRVKSEVMEQQRRSEPITSNNNCDKTMQFVNNRSRSTEDSKNDAAQRQKLQQQQQQQQQAQQVQAQQAQQQAITSLYSGIPRSNGFVSATNTYSGALSSSAQVMSLYDPFCVGCQGPHVAGASCLENLKSSQLGATAAAAPLFSLQTPGLSYYMQVMMAAAARRDMSMQQQPAVPVSTAANTEVISPHICNWNIGSTSCGKIFATSDELLAHVRSHAVTSTPSSNAAATSAASVAVSSAPSPYMMPGLDKLTGNPYAYFQQHAATIAAMSSPAAHSQLAASLMVRSTSPLSRYGVNPYKPPTNIFNPLANVPSLPVAAGVGPYCPPFGLYGQRFDSFSYH